jgi:hypothetical protein
MESSLFDSASGPMQHATLATRKDQEKNKNDLLVADVQLLKEACSRDAQAIICLSLAISLERSTSRRFKSSLVEL